jgi:hypothetical protein
MNLLRLDWKISYSSLLGWAEATCWRRLTVLLRTLRSISTAGTLAELPEPPSLLWSLTDSTPSLRFSAFRMPTLFHNGRSVIYYYYPLLLLPSRRQPNPHLNCLGPATKRCWKEGIIITATILWQFKSATGQCWREDKLGVYIVGGILKRISSNMSKSFIVVKQPGYGWSYMFESP